MKPSQLLAAAAIAFSFSGCEALWIPPVAVSGLVRSGNRDVSHRKNYWRGIDRFSIYELQRAVETSHDIDAHMPYGIVLYPATGDKLPGDGYLPRGTRLQSLRVHYRSDGINYTSVDYIGVLQSGRHKGKSVRLNNILSSTPDRFIMVLDHRFLRIANENPNMPREDKRDDSRQ